MSPPSRTAPGALFSAESQAPTGSRQALETLVEPFDPHAARPAATNATAHAAPSFDTLMLGRYVMTPAVPADGPSGRHLDENFGIDFDSQGRMFVRALRGGGRRLSAP